MKDFYYEHTQKSAKIPLLLFIAALGLGPAAYFMHHVVGHPWVRQIPLLIVMGILLFFGWVFRQMTVKVDGRSVWFGFGPSILGATIPLGEIIECRGVRNRWYYGFGIHFIPGKAILYNIAGLDAVEIKRRKGRAIRIGTDQPADLERAIREAVAQIPKA